MIVMTTGLSGLMALMRQDERPAPAAIDRGAPLRPSVIVENRPMAARRS